MDAQTCGTKHISFRVSDRDSALEGVKSKGENVVMGPRMAFGTYVAFIHGPNEVLNKLIEKKG